MYKQRQIHFFYFPFWLSIAPLMKPISLKCIDQRSYYKGIGKHKLTSLRGLSINTSCNFFQLMLLQTMFLWESSSDNI